MFHWVIPSIFTNEMDKTNGIDVHNLPLMFITPCVSLLIQVFPSKHVSRTLTLSASSGVLPHESSKSRIRGKIPSRCYSRPSLEKARYIITIIIIHFQSCSVGRTLLVQCQWQRQQQEAFNKHLVWRRADPALSICSSKQQFAKTKW